MRVVLPAAGELDQPVLLGVLYCHRYLSVLEEVALTEKVTVFPEKAVTLLGWAVIFKSQTFKVAALEVTDFPQPSETMQRY